MGQNILVIKLGALGDFIYSFGPMAAIRRAHPDDHIVLLTTKLFVGLAEASGYFNEIWIDEKPRIFDVFGWIRLHRRLKGGKFFRVYDLQNNDRTSLYFRLFSPRPEWVGAAKGASHCNDSPERSAGHSFLGHAQTLALAGIQDVTLDPLDWMKGSIEGFNLEKPYVLLVAGSSPQHPEKRWPVSHFRTLAGKLLRNGYHPVLLGTKSEADINQQIARGIDGIIDLTGKTSLFDLPVLAREAVAAVGNDTGPMHIIGVTGCPTVVLFCTLKSTIKKHGPQGKNVCALESEELENISAQAVLDHVYKKILM